MAVIAPNGPYEIRKTFPKFFFTRLLITPAPEIGPLGGPRPTAPGRPSGLPRTFRGSSRGWTLPRGLVGVDLPRGCPGGCSGVFEVGWEHLWQICAFLDVTMELGELF